MEYSLEALGQIIREHREAMEPKLTQEQLGHAAGYGSGAGVSISRIESGMTRPGSERLEGIARSLGLTPHELEAEASTRTAEFSEESGKHEDLAASSNDESLKARAKRIQQEIERRTALIEQLGDAFNEAHDRARDEYFMPFVEVASDIDGAPQPDPSGLEGGDVTDSEAQAKYRLQFTAFGVAHVLAGGVGGAAAGAAVGGAAAYGTFMAAVSFGTASTGAAISGLSGAAMTNAALALLGGGTLAAGGAGVAGGAALLTSIVATPALVLALGGLVWMATRNRKQRQELAEKLRAADAEIAASQKSFDALVEILPRATEILDYIGVHAGHALKRWSVHLGPPPLNWASMTDDERRRYRDFIEICASQLAVVSINVQELMAERGDEQKRLIELADEVLSQAHTTVEVLV